MDMCKLCHQKSHYAVLPSVLNISICHMSKLQSFCDSMQVTSPEVFRILIKQVFAMYQAVLMSRVYVVVIL